jgi:uroporphyrinogen decarboxylase
MDGLWHETLALWHKQGLPSGEEVNKLGTPTSTFLADYFGFDDVVLSNLGVQSRTWPPFKEEVLEEDAERKIVIDDIGVKKAIFKDPDRTSMPHFLEFPVRDRASWEKFKRERLNPDDPTRFPEDFEQKAKQMKDDPDREVILLADGGSYYGQLRDWTGMENLSVWFYDQPDLVKEMIERLSDVVCTVLEKYLSVVQVDYLGYSDDLAYKTGPLVSPKIFSEMMQHHYKRSSDIAHRYGIDLRLLDSDGNINRIIPLWMEAGVNGFTPLEAAAGMDVVELRKKYGRDIILRGNMDKRNVARGGTVLQDELAYKLPFMKKFGGGYIPGYDHWVAPDCTLEKYKEYVTLLKRYWWD